MKKKILVITPLPPPYYGSAISSEINLNLLEISEEFEVSNIRLNYSNDISDLGKFSTAKVIGIFNVLRHIWKAMRKDKPDIVYFMPATFGMALFRDSLFLWLIRRFKEKMLILHMRSQFKQEDLKSGFKRFFIKGMLRCDKVILLGQELKENLNSLLPGKKIFFLPNAINNSISNEKFSEIAYQRRSNDKLNLFFLSNMLEFKGWFKLLQTCKLLKDAGVNFKCHFGGGWPSEDERLKFENYVNIHELQEIVFYHGKLFGDQKSKMFEKADVFVYPTDFDACPRVVIEAMEYGLPIISTRVGTIPSMVSDGITGFLVKNNIPEELFRNINKLCNNTLRENLGSRGRIKFLNEFTISSYKEKFVSILLTPVSI